MAHLVSQAVSHQTSSALLDNMIVDPDAEGLRQCHAQAKQEIVTDDYLFRKWLPGSGTQFYGLIEALRGLCPEPVETGEAECNPSMAALAQACGVSRRTILNWLKRDAQGRFSHPLFGEALQQFLRIVPTRRYDPVGHRSVKSTHR